ncbi:hypothetical protein Pcinc_043299 [Petrolisthes cinctipes]|uniref:Ig-like domain-containing protein n=1 Tax=Petrolisthes cinctipes TaxID=88211 RepID=A0AAE1BJE6_PETCI|nr:hypothetical protein Pcinc_043299 [Petrolisthes cinctipes]
MLLCDAVTDVKMTLVLRVQEWVLPRGGGGTPHFGPAEDEVTVKAGDTAKLPCIVLNLNDKSVTWLRRRDLHILTAGHHTYSADQRFQVVHAEGSSEWTLVVRYAQLRDAGVYDCQVNTQHKLSRPVTLKVYAKLSQRHDNNILSVTPSINIITIPLSTNTTTITTNTIITTAITLPANILTITSQPTPPP